MRLPKFLLLAVAIGLAGPVSGDVSLSQSNNPQTSFQATLATLLGQERVAMAKMNPGDVNRLSRVPARKEPVELYSRAYLETLPTAKGGDQWHCLAEALYFEARGESVRGQFAVAEVILNRVESSKFPDTVCDVVNQGTGEKFRCQFTYTCDGLAETISEPRAWKRVGKVAKVMLDGAPRELTEGALFYHTKAVKPKWAQVFRQTTTVGDHKFYTPAQANS